MSDMLWGGVFEKNPSKKLIKFMSGKNIEIDSILIPYDIKGSIAHVKMLKDQKILKPKEATEIIKALEKVYSDWQKGKFKLKEEFEDVHMNVEAAVTKITKHGKKLHTARSRNDQVNLDMRLYTRDAIKEIEKQIKKLQKSFSKHKKNMEFIGFTHTRIAQPLKLKIWAGGYIEALNKDLQRLKELYKRVDTNPLGACAIGGTTWNIDPKKTAKYLGFKSIEPNPFYTISYRGELEAELLFIISIISMKLSRISEEFIWLSLIELIEIPEKYCTGSSIMPNKKNPDPLELIRGRTGKIYGNLVNVLVTMKGLMSGHNADTQETKEVVMNSIETIIPCLDILSDIVKEIKFNKKKIKSELERGNAYATIMADELVRKGLSFREAHERIGEMIKKKKD